MRNWFYDLYIEFARVLWPKHHWGVEKNLIHIRLFYTLHW